MLIAQPRRVAYDNLSVGVGAPIELEPYGAQPYCDGLRTPGVLNHYSKAWKQLAEDNRGHSFPQLFVRITARGSRKGDCIVQNLGSNESATSARLPTGTLLAERKGALPLYSDSIIAKITRFPCILNVRFDGKFCAVDAVAEHGHAKKYLSNMYLSLPLPRRLLWT